MRTTNFLYHYIAPLVTVHHLFYYTASGKCDWVARGRSGENQRGANVMGLLVWKFFVATPFFLLEMTATYLKMIFLALFAYPKLKVRVQP